MWHVSPQHFPTNSLCQPLQFVPHSSSSIQLIPFLSLPSFSIMLFLLCPFCVAVNAVIICLFPHDVADEIPCSPSHVSAEISHLNHLQDFIVCDSLLPPLPLFLASSLRLHCCSANVFTAVYICPP